MPALFFNRSQFNFIKISGCGKRFCSLELENLLVSVALGNSKNLTLKFNTLKGT